MSISFIMVLLLVGVFFITYSMVYICLISLLLLLLVVCIFVFNLANTFFYEVNLT